MRKVSCRKSFKYKRNMVETRSSVTKCLNKKGSNFRRSCQKSSYSQQFLPKKDFAKQTKKLLNIWAIFVSIFVALTFQKQPNLVALTRRHCKGRERQGEAFWRLYALMQIPRAVDYFIWPQYGLFFQLNVSIFNYLLLAHI